MQAVLSGKTDLLRKYEQLVFSVAFYLLNDVERAAQTSQAALMELASDETFPACGEEGQQSKARSVAMRHALLSFKASR